MKKMLSLIMLISIFVFLIGCSPEIIQNETHIEAGEEYNLKNMVEVEEGNEIKIKQDNIDNSTIGVYDVVFSIGKKGKEYEKILSFEVVDTQPPEIILYKDEIEVDGDFKVENFFEASDNLDGDVTSDLTIVENSLDTSKEGVYKIVIKATDSQENKVEKEFNIKVEDKLEEMDIIAIEIINAYKKILKDPNSLEIHSIKIDEDYVSWRFKMDCTAKNSFGGAVRRNIYMSSSSYKVEKESDYPFLFAFEDDFQLISKVLYDESNATELDVNKIMRNLDKFK